MKLKMKDTRHQPRPLFSPQLCRNNNWKGLGSGLRLIGAPETAAHSFKLMTRPQCGRVFNHHDAHRTRTRWRCPCECLAGGWGVPSVGSLEGSWKWMGGLVVGFELLVISSLHTKLSIQLLLANGSEKAGAFTSPAGSNFALVTFW